MYLCIPSALPLAPSAHEVLHQAASSTLCTDTRCFLHEDDLFYAQAPTRSDDGPTIALAVSLVAFAVLTYRLVAATIADGGKTTK